SAGRYLPIQARHSFIPASLSNVGSFGSLAWVEDKRPTLPSIPAGNSSMGTEAARELMKNIGFQRSSLTLLIASTPSGGRVATIRAWQPVALSATICRSIEASEDS